MKIKPETDLQELNHQALLDIIQHQTNTVQLRQRDPALAQVKALKIGPEYARANEALGRQR
jgi:hypothetical protein